MLFYNKNPELDKKKYLPEFQPLFSPSKVICNFLHDCVKLFPSFSFFLFCQAFIQKIFLSCYFLLLKLKPLSTHKHTLLHVSTPLIYFYMMLSCEQILTLELKLKLPFLLTKNQIFNLNLKSSLILFSKHFTFHKKAIKFKSLFATRNFFTFRNFFYRF